MKTPLAVILSAAKNDSQHDSMTTSTGDSQHDSTKLTGHYAPLSLSDARAVVFVFERPRVAAARRAGAGGAAEAVDAVDARRVILGRDARATGRFATVAAGVVSPLCSLCSSEIAGVSAGESEVTGSSTGESAVSSVEDAGDASFSS